MKARFMVLLAVMGILASGCASGKSRVTGDAEAYNRRGVDYANKGDYDQAIRDLSTAIEINPRYAEAYNNRGVAYGKEGAYDQAIRDLSTAIEINPRYAQAYCNRGIAYGSKGAYDQAIRDLKEACELGWRDACKELEGVQPQ